MRSTKLWKLLTATEMPDDARFVSSADQLFSAMSNVCTEALIDIGSPDAVAALIVSIKLIDDLIDNGLDRNVAENMLVAWAAQLALSIDSGASELR